MAKANENIDYELLGKYFQGECSPAEKAEAEAWIEASEENRLTFEALQEAWDLSPRVEAQEKVNTEVAWQKVAARSGISPTAVPDDTPYLHRQQPKRRSAQVWLLAASFVLACLAGYFIFLKGPTEIDREDPRMIVMKSGDSPRSIQLPDGSKVRLAPHSQLSFPEVFDQQKRLSQLQGKAFFEVQHQKGHPFIIEAGETEVKVLGTRFSVDSQEEQVAVAVESGKVAFAARQNPANQAVILTQEEKAVFQGSEQRIQRVDSVSADEFFWSDRKLVFRNTPLAEVEQVLERSYGIDLQLENERLKNCRLTTVFENEKVSRVLEVIARTFQIEHREEGGIQILSGDGCP